MKWLCAVAALVLAASPLKFWPKRFPLPNIGLDDVALAVDVVRQFQKSHRERRADLLGEGGDVIDGSAVDRNWHGVG
jgi:hypothetical protein